MRSQGHPRATPHVAAAPPGRECVRGRWGAVNEAPATNQHGRRAGPQERGPMASSGRPGRAAGGRGGRGPGPAGGRRLRGQPMGGGWGGAPER